MIFVTIQKMLDFYIGLRYTSIRYIECRYKGGIFLNDNPVLTESTYYILLSLYTPQHGYGIMQRTEALSGGRVRLAAGTLYGALTSLCDKGWIAPLPVDENSRKKEYQLTAKGLEVLKNELNRLRQLVANGETVLKEEAL